MDEMPQSLAFYFYASVWWKPDMEEKFFGPKSQMKL